MTQFLIALGAVWLCAIVDAVHDRRQARREARERQQKKAEWDLLVAMCRETRERQLNVRRAA